MHPRVLPNLAASSIKWLHQVRKPKQGANMTPEETMRIVEFGEAEAYADLQRAAPADFAAQLGMRVEKIGSATGIVMAGADIPLFNRVIGLGVEPTTEEMVARVLSLYEEAGVHGMVQLAPSAQPAGLPGWLEARGVKRRD